VWNAVSKLMFTVSPNMVGLDMIKCYSTAPEVRNLKWRTPKQKYSYLSLRTTGNGGFNGKTYVFGVLDSTGSNEMLCNHNRSGKSNVAAAKSEEIKSQLKTRKKRGFNGCHD
jgi:hypothetical protein